MIIEVIGVAGSGKSTLSKAMAENIDHVILEHLPPYRNAKNIPFFIRNSLAAFPILSHIYFHKNRRYSLWDHFKLTVMINGWHQVLNQKALNSDSIYILDQGPVYMITFETMFGSGGLESNSSKKFWDRAFHCWAKTLDLVVWLDTALPVLVERIRVRKTWHRIKCFDDAEAYQYLESYKKTFNSVISGLLARSNTLKVLRLDTGKKSLEETVEKIINELHLEGSQIKPN